MSDPTDPIPPINPRPMTGGPFEPGTTGLPSNVAAALACIPLIGGIIFYVLEKRDLFVRFYAMQSIIFGGAWLMFSLIHTVVSSVFGAIPWLRYVLVPVWLLVWAVVTIAFLVVFVITVIKAFSGVRWDIPYIGPLARKQVDGSVL